MSVLDDELTDEERSLVEADLRKRSTRLTIAMARDKQCSYEKPGCMPPAHG